jgi:hypothetical protein
VQKHVVAASDQPDRQITDDRLGATGLGPAQWGYGRCDDGNPHLIGATCLVHGGPASSIST